MNPSKEYVPGPASARIGEKDGDNWTLVLVKELQHPPEGVWRALTDPAHLSEWAPFDADKNLGAIGPVQLTTVGSPKPHITQTEVSRAEPGKLLEYKWGGSDIRWELEEIGQGTRLTLWASINNRFIAMGAAGWQVCLDVLDRLLAGEPMGRVAGPEAMQFEGWKQLHAEYSKKFGVEAPSW